MYGNHRERGRPERAGVRPDAARHHRGRASGAERGVVRRVDEIGPVADRPVVANRADHGDRRAARRLDRGEAGEHVLAVNEIDPLPGDHVREKIRERRVQPLVLEVVADVRDRRRGRAELQDPETVVRRLARAARRAGARLDDRDRMSQRPQATRELVRAPAAAAADRRERVGREEDVQSLKFPDQKSQDRNRRTGEREKQQTPKAKKPKSQKPKTKTESPKTKKPKTKYQRQKRASRAPVLLFQVTLVAWRARRNAASRARQCAAQL